MELALIAAVAENGVIGADGGLPWHHPADMAHFKETTTGHPVIVGRTTFENIRDGLGGPLPERTNVVLTTRPLEVDAETSVVAVDSVDAAVAAAEETGAEVAYVAGGASVYEQFLPLADRLVITEVPGRPEGDSFFPEWDPDDWYEVERETREELAFVTYERVRG